MSRRPRSITIVGFLFVCVGFLSLGSGAWRFAGDRNTLDFGIVAVSALMAGIGGAFVLRGRNWARWLLAVWMGGHVVISALHSPWKMLTHVMIFVPILYFLFRSQASASFRGAGAVPQGETGP